MYPVTVILMLMLFPLNCHCVLPDYPPVVGETFFNRDEVIATYFNLGLQKDWLFLILESDDVAPV